MSTQLHYALEVGPQDQAIGWVLELPGCHVLTSLDQAQTKVLAATREYWDWLTRHGEAIPEGILELACVEVVRSREDKRQGRTSAFFQADAEPVSPETLDRCLRLLDWSRQDLWQLLEPLPPQALAWGYPGGGDWTIKTILQHIAGAERWYLTKLWPRLPELPRSRTPQERLERVRALALGLLTAAPPAQRSIVVRVPDGERWSLRKVLRRMLYHERYHLRKIEQILHDRA